MFFLSGKGCSEFPKRMLISIGILIRLRELRQKTTVDTAARDEQIKRINDLQDYISQQTALLTEFDEALVRRWIKQITIWDDHITVELKSGVNIDVDA